MNRRTRSWKKKYERKKGRDMTEVIDQSYDSLSCFVLFCCFFYLNRRSLISCVRDTIRYE